MTRVLGLVAVAGTLIACGRSSVTSIGDNTHGVTEDPATTIVRPLFDGASAWNTYVTDDAPELAALSGTKCSGGFSYRDCVHAGELRRVFFSGRQVCDGLTITDSLGAFQWSCLPSGDGVVAYSTGLAEGMGLRHLVASDGTRWRTMHIAIADGDAQLYETPDEIWWPNPVVPAPEETADFKGIALAEAGTIYVLTDDRTTSGLRVVADDIGLVTLPGVQLTGSDGVIMACDAYIDTTGAFNSRPCVVTAEGVAHVWLELNVQASRYAGVAIALRDVERGRLRDITVPTHSDGVQLRGVRASRFERLAIADSDALILVGGGGNLLADVRLAGTGVICRYAVNNVFAGLTQFGALNGFYMEHGCTNNVLANAFFSSNHSNGIFMLDNDAAQNIIVGATIAAVGESGVVLTNTTTLSLATIVNATSAGLVLSAGSTSASNLTIFQTGGAAVTLTGGSHRFSGQLKIGSTGPTSCSTDATPRGLDDTCAANGSSPTSLEVATGIASVSGSFVGEVTSDAVNSSAPEGVTALPADRTALDFIGAATASRGWAEQGAPISSAAANCPGWDGAACWRASGETIVLADLALTAADVQLRNTTFALGSANATFIDGAVCPAGLSGNAVVTDNHEGDGGNVFLAAAIEVLGDRTGDDDGLCESSEACIYAPNFGAYQGHGDYRAHSCVFQDGVVSNVTMYAYPSNGY